MPAHWSPTCYYRYQVMKSLPRQSASALIAPRIAPLTLSDLVGFIDSIAETAVVSDFRKNSDAAATRGALCDGSVELNHNFCGQLSIPIGEHLKHQRRLPY